MMTAILIVLASMVPIVTMVWHGCRRVPPTREELRKRLTERYRCTNAPNCTCSKTAATTRACNCIKASTRFVCINCGSRMR